MPGRDLVLIVTVCVAFVGCQSVAPAVANYVEPEQRTVAPDLATANLAYAVAADDVVAQFGGDSSAGLDEPEAQRRLERDGPNSVPERPPASVFVLIARQFADAMVLLLIGATVVSFVIGENLDGFIILAIVVVNGGFGALQEGRAQHAARAVRALLQPHAIVIRHGDAREIDATGSCLRRSDGDWDGGSGGGGRSDRRGHGAGDRRVGTDRRVATAHQARRTAAAPGDQRSGTGDDGLCRNDGRAWTRADPHHRNRPSDGGGRDRRRWLPRSGR